MKAGFRCSSCGQWHDELPLSFGADAPYWYEVVAPEERSWRTELSSDQCIVDGKNFFIRGCLEVPLIDGPGPIVWGVWVSLSETNFDRMSDLWEQSGREAEPPYFGWFSTLMPFYPDTLNLKTKVYTRPLGNRPLIELQPSDHPLSIDQHNGISLEKWQRIIESILHDDSPE
jgi:hypothetical protein